MSAACRGCLAAALGRLALALCAALLCALVLEIVLRLRPDLDAPAAAAACDRSPVFVRPEPERAHPWARGAPDPWRVAVVGDSFALGAGVQPDDAYAARLERLLNLNAGARPAMVRVFGACGTSTFQQFGLLREALAWQPHLVILGICLNDTEDWTTPAELAAWRQAMTPRAPGPVLARLTTRSRLLAWVHRQAEYLRCRRAFRDYYRRLYDPDYAGWRRTSWALELMRNDCANEGAVCCALIFPLLSENLAPGRYPFAFAHQRLRERLAALDVPCLDLLPAFTGKNPLRLQAIPGVDPHPSEIAHRLTSEMLLAWLLERHLLDPQYRPRQSWTDDHARWEQIRMLMLAAPRPAGQPAVKP